MAQAYLFTNGILYLLLAVLCTVKHASTSRGTGFLQLNESGHSEYLVIYGGLQLGLGCAYLLVGRDPAYFRLGIQASLLLYAPIVIYRLTTLAIYRPTSAVTFGTAGLELLLLIWAAAIWPRVR